MSTAAESGTEDAYTAGQLSRLFSKTSKAANQDAALVSLFTPAAADQSGKTVANGNRGQNALAAAKKRKLLFEAEGKASEQKNNKKRQKKERDETLREEEPPVVDRSTLKARAKLAKQREQARSTDPRNPRTVFVGNVSTAAKKRDLLVLFRLHGPIESVRFRSAAPADAGVAKRLAVIHKKLSRQSLNAYIVYKEVGSVSKAIDALNGHCLSGLHLRVDCLPGCEGDAKKDESKCIFLGNLHFKCDEESVRAAFSQCGQVTNVRLVRDARSGVGRGFGFVQFADPAAVELALRLAGTEVSGRPVRVSRCSDTVAKKKTEAAVKKKKNSARSASDAAEGNRENKKKKQKKMANENSPGRNGWKRSTGAEIKKSNKNGGGKGKWVAGKTAKSGSAPGRSPRPTNRTTAQSFQRMLDKRKGRSASRASAAANSAKRQKK